MREQKRIYDMTDRELRTYKREMRRRRERRRKMTAAFAAICLIAVLVVSYRALITSASAESSAPMYKYYTRITLKSSDTLWSIADQYIDYAKYDSKKAYIKEVCSINRLDDEDALVSGQTLVVPYYSDVYVK